MAGPITRNKRQVKKGIQFCLMVCGASGTGRTTFVNTLCGQKVLTQYNESHFDPKTAHEEVPIKINPVNVDLDLGDEGARISLTIVDTPGFGDLINNEQSFSEIAGYLERQYDDILAEESRVKRNPRFRDNRVHALLYFIAPTGHGLRELDIQLMMRLSSHVNVIPVIGKADSLTPAELAESKKLIMEDIENNMIPIYNFPYDQMEDDEETVAENSTLRSLLPFAIVGSEDSVPVAGKAVRAREYPWGYAEVDNPDHCDFAALRAALFESHLADLKEITHDYLYERYRTKKLTSENPDSNIEESSVQTFIASNKDHDYLVALKRDLELQAEKMEQTRQQMLRLQLARAAETKREEAAGL